MISLIVICIAVMLYCYIIYDNTLVEEQIKDFLVNARSVRNLKEVVCRLLLIFNVVFLSIINHHDHPRATETKINLK
jgi:hypothetical protein